MRGGHTTTTFTTFSSQNMTGTFGSQNMAGGGLNMNNLMSMMGGMASSVGETMEGVVTVKVKFEQGAPPPYTRYPTPMEAPLAEPKVWETAEGPYGLSKAVTIKLDPSVTSCGRVHEALLEFLRSAGDRAAVKWEPSIQKLSFEGDALPLELMFSQTGVKDGDEFQALAKISQTVSMNTQNAPGAGMGQDPFGGLGGLHGGGATVRTHVSGQGGSLGGGAAVRTHVSGRGENTNSSGRVSPGAGEPRGGSTGCKCTIM